MGIPLRSSFDSPKLSPAVYNTYNTCSCAQASAQYYCIALSCITVVRLIKLMPIPLAWRCCILLCCCFFVFFFCVAVTNLTRVCMWYFSMCFISNKLYHAHLYVYARSNTLFNSSRKSDLFFFCCCAVFVIMETWLNFDVLLCVFSNKYRRLFLRWALLFLDWISFRPLPLE